MDKPSSAGWDINHRLMNRLKIRHLALLLQIEKLGSLTRVAEAMATSQPSVTQALAEMEDMFGAPLFERTPRGMNATQQGLLVLERARSMLNDIELLQHDMHALKHGRQAHLHVGLIPYISGKLVTAATQSVFAQHRPLTLSLHEGLSSDLIGMLREHALDCVIARVSPKLATHDLQQHVLYSQQPRLISGRKLAARLGRRKLDWKVLQGLDWVLGPKHTPIHRQVMDLFLSVGVTPPEAIIETASSKLVGEFISHNDNAVSIVPAETAEDLVRISNVSIVPYSIDWNLAPIALFTRSQGPTRDVDKAFSQALKQLCQTHPANRSPGSSYFY
ncbi:LysR family transcriptional regulator [Alcaligenes endophyticus]|uniref:LysR family transcriptional regulator n=1 Tax=Alcaligenes endophyticus TaxID=1929088 RepID=A0ABT8EMW7_9BURK|nr:LysR family transcriptional regulator [Alcaligenes endophyticus]MCX5591526.1 LysR family transcriptional regulator [Alcaligenes endophyticus]MDN4122593.1 LysR family transcriptional regulator [Alcaligenes endophyticus]